MTTTETSPTEDLGKTKDKWADRTVVTAIEFSDAEEATLTAQAAQKGLTFEEYIRTLLGLPA